MAEAIISRRGNKANASSSAQLQTNIFITTGTFLVPDAINNEFSVRIFGGGGGGTASSGGGGGWMNNGVFELSKGSAIPITIGSGGITNANYSVNGTTGGSSSFGIYLSANGGTGALSSDVAYGDPRAGGGWGGSGGGTIGISRTGTYQQGGKGYQFGGGGPNGNGGPWGGGGGLINIYTIWYQYWESTEVFGYSNAGVGIGGTYGGNGGVNGTNTINDINVPSELQGEGLAGKSYNTTTSSQPIRGGGGGGGYGGNGGSASNSTSRFQPTMGFGDSRWCYSIGAGGGGGYGGDGGSANRAGSGGGGGYGGRGENGTEYCGGGGGSYGDGASLNISAGYGGGGANGQNGGNGICIIQWYTTE